MGFAHEEPVTQGEKSGFTDDELVKILVSNYVLSTPQNKFAYSAFKHESKLSQESSPAFTPQTGAIDESTNTNRTGKTATDSVEQSLVSDEEKLNGRLSNTSQVVGFIMLH